MRAYFSKRHADSIFSKKLSPKVSSKLRVAVNRTLTKFSNTNANGWNESNLTYEQIEERLKTFYGKEDLQVYDIEKKHVGNGVGLMLLHDYPAKFFDVIEAWFDCSSGESSAACERELNQIFEIHDSPWRCFSGTMLLIDSDYLRQEVVAKTQTLLRSHSFMGPLDEFSKAVSSLTAGDTKESITNAHKSVESVMKAVLETDDHLRFGQLLKKLLDSGMIPSYYDEFLRHFELLAIGAVKERNQPGTGHGQGAETIEIPKSLAEFTLHLAGSINVFILKRWSERKIATDAEERAAAFRLFGVEPPLLQ